MPRKRIKTPPNLRLPPEERKLRASKAGKAADPENISDGAHFHHLKIQLGRGNAIGDTDMDWLLKRVKDSKYAALDLLQYVDEMRRNATEDTKLPIGQLMIQAYKTIHGNKIMVESKNINLDIEMTGEEAQAVIDRLLGQEKTND